MKYLWILLIMNLICSKLRNLLTFSQENFPRVGNCNPNFTADNKDSSFHSSSNETTFRHFRLYLSLFPRFTYLSLARRNTSYSVSRCALIPSSRIGVALWRRNKENLSFLLLLTVSAPRCARRIFVAFSRRIFILVEVKRAINPAPVFLQHRNGYLWAVRD